MKPVRAPQGKCPIDADPPQCRLQCKYNYFESDELTINSFELKCLNCGWRETIAYRSDDDLENQPANPKQCPFCDRCDLPVGLNPCGE